jgi:hypothetical protein
MAIDDFLISLLFDKSFVGWAVAERSRGTAHPTKDYFVLVDRAFDRLNLNL